MRIANFFTGHRRPVHKWLLRWWLYLARLLIRYGLLSLEILVLSPVLLLLLIWVKFKGIKIYITGQSLAISSFIPGIEEELRKRLFQPCQLKRLIFLCLCDDANSQVRKMYDEFVVIYGSESKIRRRFLFLIFRLGAGEAQLTENKSASAWDNKSGPFKFATDETAIGESFLKQVDIDNGEEFICFATRTESYYLQLIELGAKISPRTIRNPDELNYIMASEKIIQGRLPFVRMGKNLENVVDDLRFPRVIDYASKFRTDFLDVFLISRCKFMILGNTGLFWICAMFGKATVHCDLYDVRHQVLTGDLMIFQKLWLVREKRLATVSEMLAVGGFYSKESHQEILGLELIKNSVEEIISVSDEMNARIDGTWETTPEDEELQQRYSDLLLKYSNKPTWRGGGRVGTQFLRDNQDLLK